MPSSISFKTETRLGFKHIDIEYKSNYVASFTYVKKDPYAKQNSLVRQITGNKKDTRPFDEREILIDLELQDIKDKYALVLKYKAKKNKKRLVEAITELGNFIIDFKELKDKLYLQTDVENNKYIAILDDFELTQYLRMLSIEDDIINKSIELAYYELHKKYFFLGIKRLMNMAMYCLDHDIDDLNKMIEIAIEEKPGENINASRIMETYKMYMCDIFIAKENMKNIDLEEMLQSELLEPRD